jgi:hypothetical protein
MSDLTIANWLSIAGVAVAAVSASIAATNFLASFRERRRNARKSAPRVKVTINGTSYENGWRSVQLHIVAAGDGPFQYGSWRIERATLLRPRQAILARAADDDYATGVFYPEHPVRVLEGRADGRPQQFALEFFIKFPAEKNVHEAVFKVKFSNKDNGLRRTSVVCASLPPSAESAPVAGFH